MRWNYSSFIIWAWLKRWINWTEVNSTKMSL
jgi:hypothetical protein